MRPIDADALLKEVRENKELYERERVYLEGLLLNAPTVLPEKEIIPVCKVTFDDEELQKIVDEKAKEIISEIKKREVKRMTDKEEQLNNMRLIDADKLKESAIPCEIHNGTLTDLCVPLYQIDNAPIVPLPDFKAGYKQAILDGKTNFSRPNGAWKVKNFDEETGISDSCWCPFCGMVKAQVYNNFCGNCGADMRGDEE